MENMTLAGAVIITGLVVVFVALIGLWFIVAIMGKIFTAISQKKQPQKPVQPAPPAPKEPPPLGMPPIIPDSVVSINWSAKPSSPATEATFSGMPTPRLTTAFGTSSMAQRRPIKAFVSNFIGSTALTGILNEPVSAGFI